MTTETTTETPATETSKPITVRVDSIDRAKWIVAAHNKRVDKINKRRAAAGETLVAHATLTVLRTYEAEVVRTKAHEDEDPFATWKAMPVKEMLAELEITAERAIIAGWEICANIVAVEVDEKISATASGYMVSNVHGASLTDMAPFAARGGDCDHCKQKRRRASTYVVRKVDGERDVKLVGSSCVKDFTGHIDPRRLIAYADVLSALAEELDDLESESKSGKAGDVNRRKAASLVEYLAYVRASINKHGWVSKGMAYDTGRIATASDAWTAFDIITRARRDVAALMASDAPERDTQTGELAGELANWEAVKKDWLPSEQDEKDAAADLALVEETLAGKATHDDFETNLQVVINQGYAFGKNLGLCAAVCRAADRIRTDAARKAFEAARVNEWFGEVGKREVFTLTVVFVKEIDGQFGTTFLHIFRDDKNRTAKWFSTSENLETGKTFRIKATVKKHDDYQGKKETVLTRGVLEKEKPAKVKKSKKAAEAV